MSALTRQLATGETMVFDKVKRDLFIVQKGNPAKTLEEAEKLYAQNKALKFNKSQLGSINSALSHIVLLGASE
jgi:hypothetical protein